MQMPSRPPGHLGHDEGGSKRGREQFPPAGSERCKLTPHQRREAIARRDTGDESLTDIARNYNVSHSTISRL
jgi:hypothetical protein